MLFHSLQYFVFLGIVLVVYWSLRTRTTARLLLLFLASLRFYMAWNPRYVILLLFSMVLDYSMALLIHRSTSPRWRKVFLTCSVVGDMGMLGTFKYFNFFMDALRQGFSLFGVHVRLPFLDVLLPVGISFFTFQSLAYTIDVYRGVCEPERNFLRYGAFLSFFPQLVAGPIVRGHYMLPQFRRTPELSTETVGEGLFLIMKGLVKKVAIADYLAVNLVDRFFDNPHAFTSLEGLIALYAYTMQLYCDFSGYTDLARGSAKLLGLQLPENFLRPYKAASPAEFWRRWHMTLSSWLRDYLYFPLGGSRRSPGRTYFNLWVTLFLIGVWHGAGWTFVIYGSLHGVAMVLHRYSYKRSGRTRDTVDPMWLHVIKVVATLHYTVFSRILFRSPDLQTASAVVDVLASFTTSTAQVPITLLLLLVSTYAWHYTPLSWVETIKAWFMKMPAPVQGLCMAAAGALLVHMASSQAVPYIYFQF